MEIAPAYRNSTLRFYSFALAKPLAAPRSHRFRIGKATVVDYLIGLLPTSPPLSLARRLRRGDHYFTARQRCKIVAVARICYRDTKEVSLQSGEASLISFYTRPEYRGRGLYVLLIQTMLHYLKQRGYQTAYIWADRANAASIRGIEKAGFMPWPAGLASC